MKKLLAIGLVLVLAAGGAAWAAGGRDKGFGEGGFTILDDPVDEDEGLTDLTVLPNGKILAVGSRGGSQGFLVARFNRNGRPDRSFDGDGFNVQPRNLGPLQPRALNRMDVDSKGRFVAAGLAAGPGGGSNAFGIARYRRNGLPDPSFGNGGFTIIQPPDAGDAFGVDAGPGDKVVAAGKAINATTFEEQIAVVRLKANGQPDPSPVPGGLQVIDIVASSTEAAGTIKVLGNGSVVIAGQAEGGAFIAKLDPSGNLAQGFGSGGATIADMGGGVNPSGSVFDIASGGNGRFVVVGDASGSGGSGALFAARFRANGKLDPGFADGGVFRLDPTGGEDSGFAVAVQPDGRVVIAGVRDADSNAGNTWLVRLTARGRLDKSFGGDGQIVASATPAFDEAFGVALQPDGRIVVAGDANVLPTGGQMMVGRFRGDHPCFGRAATITGSPRRDVLRGTPGRDVFSSLGGADTLNGRGGRDLICGGAGRDRLRGGKGADRLNGGPGRDRCRGGRGRDAIRRCER
jgi:uncharacterized delta-60 repeat protein